MVGGLLTAGATASVGTGPAAGAWHPRSSGVTVTYRGYQVQVPRTWTVVRLATSPHVCIRFDRPAVYVGRPGDQSRCPAHLIGGAPSLLLEPLDSRSLPAPSGRSVPATLHGAVADGRLPAQGPVSVPVRSAGVLVTAVYGARAAAVTSRILARGQVLASAVPVAPGASARPSATVSAGASVPATYRGPGFDACTAPSQSAMNAWHDSGAYGAVGVYIGGVSRGCDQPNLSANWVTRQVSRGWHLIPTYVGLQAPCTGFYNRMSSDPATARAQGRAEAVDAANEASALAMAAPSTIYADIEGYDDTVPTCVAAVLSYVSGWTRGLHGAGYQAGIYSSGSSGMRDLSTNYTSKTYSRPDQIWIAWWNDVADVDGGSYVARGLWSQHRIHQYVGGVWETHGGYGISIDRDFVNVTSAVELPDGCPTSLDFSAYRVLKESNHGNEVLAVQCQLARRGFDPGEASGTVGWRTAAAVAAFNVSRGLSDHPVVSRRTWTALLSGGRIEPLVRGATGAAVRKLQRSLSASLERHVAVTGLFDGATRQAVLSYQRARGLTVDGNASRATWNALQAGR
jgi:hypothetical protein